MPRGTNCDCTPYPPLTADGLTASTGRTVKADQRLGRRGTPPRRAQQLDSRRERDRRTCAARTRRDRDRRERRGALDVLRHQHRLLRAADPGDPEEPRRRSSRRVHELAAGRKVLVVLLDYWSVWLGGKYAAAKGEAYVAAAEEMTDQVNAVIKSTASAAARPTSISAPPSRGRTTRTTRRTTSRTTATTRTRPGTSRSPRPPRP